MALFPGDAVASFPLQTNHLSNTLSLTNHRTHPNPWVAPRVLELAGCPACSRGPQKSKLLKPPKPITEQALQSVPPGRFIFPKQASISCPSRSVRHLPASRSVRPGSFTSGLHLSKHLLSWRLAVPPTPPGRSVFPQKVRLVIYETVANVRNHIQ